MDAHGACKLCETGGGYEFSAGFGDVLQAAEDRKRRLRSELLRWHPDKFQAHFGAILKAEDAEQIMAKVKEISIAINLANK